MLFDEGLAVFLYLVALSAFAAATICNFWLKPSAIG